MNARVILTSAAAAAVACALLTGCGNGTAAPPHTAPISVNPPTPTPSPTASGATVTRQPIGKPVTLGGQGRTLTVTALATGCHTDRLVAHASSASVTLTVEVATPRATGRMCPDYAKLTRLSTTLAAPLAGRRVFDGADGRQLTVKG